MSYRYLSQDDAAAFVESSHPQAQQLPALSELLESDLMWDPASRTLVFLVDTWIEDIGYGRRLHTTPARNVNADKDLAFGFSRGAKTADPELVAAAADEILDLIAGGVTAADNASAAIAVTSILHGGLAESPSRKPMFTALRAQWEQRTAAA